MEELESRLRNRATETEEKIQVRLKNAVDEVEFGHEKGNFDLIVVNETVDETVAAILRQLEVWYPEIDFSEASK